MRTNPISDALEFLTQGEWTNYVFWLADDCQHCDCSSQSSPRLKSALSFAPAELAGPILYRRDVVAAVFVETPSHLH
jgi:hypothetical protein